MPEQGDKKTYIGDIWANEDKYDYQKKFIEDTIESYQYPNGNFNADMLDGFHATDFATKRQGELAETALQSFLLGTTLITNDDPDISQYIKSDAIKLEESVLNNVPWGTNPENLTEAIEKLFILLQNGIDGLNTNKVDKSKVIINDIIAQDGQGNDRWQVLSDNNFTDADKALLQSLSGSVTELECYNSETGVSEGSKMAVNADTINGLQFILVTKAIYNNLSSTCKNNWRNIFIFVDEIPADYDSPLNSSFSNGFEFRVDDTRNYIVYKNKDATQWMDLISLSDLYTKFAGDLHNTIINTINSDTGSISDSINDVISQTTIESIIKNIDNISINDARSWPFIPQILSDDFVYDIYIMENGIKKSFISNIERQNGYAFKTIDLTSICDSIKTSKDNLEQSMTNYIDGQVNTLDGRINALEGLDIETNLDNINDNVRVLENTVSNTTSSLGSLSNRVSALENRVSTLEAWKNESNMIHLMIGRWDFRDSQNRDVTGTPSRAILPLYNDSQPRTDINPAGIFVRANNNFDPKSEISSDILSDIEIQLTIKGVSNSTIHRQNYEIWFTFGNAYSDSSVSPSEKYQNRWRQIPKTAYTNSQLQKYYMSDKLSFEWVDVVAPNKGYYLVEATPYYKGRLCGNVVRLTLQTE